MARWVAMRELGVAATRVATLALALASTLWAALWITMSSAGAAERLAVSVGTTNALADVGMFVAHKRGYFDSEGIGVRFIAFDAAARMTGALASGELDAGGGGVAAGLFNAVARGTGVKIVADKSTSIPGYATAGLMLRRDIMESGTYKGLADLKGRKIAMAAPGTSSSTSTARALATVGLSIKDVELVYLSFPNMVTGLQNKAIDAAFLTEPGVTTAVNSGAAVRLLSDDQMFPNHQVAVTVFSGRFIATKDQAAVRFMRAFLRGTRDYIDVIKDGKLAGPGAEAVIAILTEYSLIKDAAVYAQLAVHGCDPDGRVNAESLGEDLAFFRGQGLIQGKVEVADAVDASIAAAAVRDLGPYRRK